MDSGIIPKTELISRMDRFTNKMDKAHENWEMCMVVGGLNMFYLTGTMCDGLLLIKRGGGASLWVRRSYDRAIIESNFNDIRPMRSFRDLSGAIAALPDELYLDTSNASMEWYGLLGKYFTFSKVVTIDNILLETRSVKSKYELDIMLRAGTETDRIYRDVIPSLLYSGLSEADLGAELYAILLKHGFHGVTRFSMRNTDSILGHISFGESPLYPSAFNGASGIKGLCPAVPVLGNRDRFLCEGDLIYIDIGAGIDGYHIDKTIVLSYKIPQPEHVISAHRHCLELQYQSVSMLKPGAVPSEIYKTIIDSVDEKFRQSFMGVSGRTVPFIGHGVGLCIDEMPVIAKGFDSPLEKNMTIAIEPKIGIEGIGMVGSENTYRVTETGGVSLTGQSREIEVV